jgi:hypothetical protein
MQHPPTCCVGLIGSHTDRPGEEESPTLPVWTISSALPIAEPPSKPRRHTRSSSPHRSGRHTRST